MQEDKSMEPRTAAELMEEIQEAERAKETEVVVEPSEGTDFAQRTLKMETMGWYYIWDTRTGGRSICLGSMLESNLKKKYPDGAPRFTAKKPLNPPHPIIPGTFKCRLHKDDPDRKRWDAMGFAICPKGDLASLYQVIRHMEKRHKSEWGAIKYDEERAEKREDREFQRSVIESVRGRPEPESPPLYVSEKDKKNKSK